MKKFLALLTAAAMIMSFTACKAKETDGGEGTDNDGGNKKSGGTVSYEDAERGFFKKGTGGYSKLLDVTSGASDGATMTITFTPEDYITDMMGGVQLNPTVFDIAANMAGNDVYVGYIYKNGSKVNMTADMWMNGGSMIMLIPNLTDKYIVTEVEQGVNAAMGGYTDALGKLPAPPSEAEIEKVVNKVYDEYFELFKNVEPEKDVEVSAGGITVKSEKTEIRLTDESVMKLALALLNAVKESDEIKNYMTDFVAIMAETDPSIGSVDINSLIDEAVKSLNDDLANETGPDITENVVTMAVYISGSDIVKRDMTVYTNGAEYGYFSYTSLNDGNSYATEALTRTSDPATLMSVTDSGTASGGTRTGESVFTVNAGENENCTIKAAYSDLSENSGKITLTSDDIIPGGAEIGLTYGKNSFIGSFAMGGVKVATVEIAVSEGATAKPVPALNESNSVSADNVSSVFDASVNPFANLDDNGVYDLVGMMLFGQMSAQYSLPDITY